MAIIAASVATAQNQLITTGKPTHDPAVACSRVPVEAEAWLEVIIIASRDWLHDETRVVIGKRHHGFVEVNQVLDWLPSILITKTNRQREVWSDLPLVLTVEKEIVPVVVKDLRSAGKVLVNVGPGGEVLN